MPGKLTGIPQHIGETQRSDRARQLQKTPRELHMVLSQYWRAVSLGVWLCCLPILLRAYPLPTLLHRLTAVGGRRTRTSPREMEHTVRLVVRLCHLQCFRGPLFPRACLRQALALYRTLTRLGYPVEIHFGVQKAGKDLHGHSWVTVRGMPVAERTRTASFTTVYSYSSAAVHSAQDAREPFAYEGQAVDQQGS